MHTLIYNGVDLSDLGVELEIIGQSSVGEPAEAPQYRRSTVRCRYTFFEESWEDNYGLILQLRDALKTNQGVLQWLDDNENVVLNRRVMVGAHDLPERDAQGTYRQSIHFSFQYLEFPTTDNIVPQTLAATFQPDGGAVITLSTVEHWTEGLETKDYSEWRSNRRRVGGTVSANGKILGNTLQTLGLSQNGLMAAKDALVAAILSADQGTLKFGSFNREVRGIKFDAMVDQAQDLIRWTLHGEFTRLPNEGNYAEIDLGVETRDVYAQGAQGLTELVLSGKIESDSAVHAYSALQEFQMGLVPDNYTLIEDASTERIIDGMDGQAFIDLTVRQIYRENKTGLVTITPTGGAALTLGIIEHFSNGYTGTLFSELHPNRARGGGVVEMSGRLQLTPSDGADTLYALMENWQTVLAANAQVTLAYGDLFSQAVRIVSFLPQVNEGINAITWTLVAHFTRFPNEQSYAVADFRVKTASLNTAGAVEITLTGTIQAQSLAAAQVALTQIRTTAVPAGYVTEEQDQDSHTVNADTDGTAFLELTFAEKYRLTAGSIVTYTMRQDDQPDTKTGMIRSIYSGTIRATATTTSLAYTAAVTQAATLGAGKYPMLMRSDIAQSNVLFLTTGNVFVDVEYSYEYLRKGTAIYIESRSEITQDAFGQDVQVVSGFVAGPSNAVCQTAYQKNVRNVTAQQKLLVLSEKSGFATAQITTAGAQLDVRFDFVLTLHVIKASSETAMKVAIESRQNFLDLTQTVRVDGVVYAGSLALATAYLNTFLAAGNYGTVQADSVTRQQQQSAQNVLGNAQTDFFALDFSQTFLSVLAGTAAILENEVTVDVTYAGTRWVALPVVGTVSVIQNTGTKEGMRRVTGMVKAATLTAAQNWAAEQEAFIQGPYEEPQQLTTKYEFLPLTTGVTGGSEANVKIYVVTFVFSEILPGLTY